MRQVIKFLSWDLPEEHIQSIALEHRSKYGEDPAIGMAHATFYNVLRRVWFSGLSGGVKGGGAEPLYVEMVTIAGVSKVFVDKACAEDELSVETPDE